MESCHKHDNHVEAQFAWLSALCWEGTLLRHASSPDWHLSLGSFGHCCMAWPLVEVKGKGKAGSSFKLAEVASPEALPWL
eukprot:2495325-Alexandrium_andersonii.AAC.1